MIPTEQGLYYDKELVIFKIPSCKQQLFWQVFVETLVKFSDSIIQTKYSTRTGSCELILVSETEICY